MSVFNVPVGYRFNPTESQLVRHYLYNTVMGLPLSCPHAVQHCDLYGQEEPWQIWEKFGGFNNINTTPADDEFDDEVAGPFPQDDLFFFTTLKKIKPNSGSSKFERHVGTNGGRWHGDNVHTFHSNGITWHRRRYCYKNPNIGITDSSWIMIEYSLDDSLMQNAPHHTVLCRIRRKMKDNNCSRKRKSGQSNPQPMPKRQLKSMKSKQRTTPPPNLPDHVAIREDMISMLNDYCLTENQINAINYHASQYFLRNCDIGDDRSLVPCEQQQYYVGEDDGVNAMHSSLSVFSDAGCFASTSLPQETNLDGVNFSFEDCSPIVHHPQLHYTSIDGSRQLFQ